MLDLRAFLLGAAVVYGLSAGAAMAGPTDDTVAKLDKDNDHSLDLAEAKTAAGDHFAALDKDSDGTLDAHEMRGVVRTGTFKAADSNHDGKISKDEYMALTEDVFRSADPSHSGKLTAAQLHSTSGQKLMRLMGAAPTRAVS